MAKKTNAKTTSTKTALTKDQLQRQMARTRESIADTVGEIKETVEQEVKTIKKGAAGILNFGQEFQKDPFVWSLGALSAGFALGYTVGYAHKNTRGKKQGEITAFAETMVDQLSTMGRGLVLPALDAKISELFGFEFSSMLEKVGDGQKSPSKNKKRRRSTPKLVGKTVPSAKKAAAPKKKPKKA